MTLRKTHKKSGKQKKSRKAAAKKYEEERREDVVQHEANYNPREEEADLKVARKRAAI